MHKHLSSMIQRNRPGIALIVAFLLLASVGAPLQTLAQFGNPDWTAQNLTHPTTSVSGEVRSTENRPVQDALVRLQTSLGGTVLSTYTDAAGKFELNNVPNGSYEVTVVHNLQQVGEWVKVLGGTTVVNLTLVANEQSSRNDGPTVSVAQFKIPEKARSALQKAEMAIHKNKIGDARQFLASALAAYPRYPEALTLRGIVAMHENNEEQARQDIEKAIDYDPQYGPAYIVMGALCNHLRQFDDAARFLDHGMSISPNSWQGYFEQSKIAVAKGDFKMALRLLERASSLIRGNFPPLHLVRAYAFIGLKNTPSATTELQTFLTEVPSGPQASAARKTLENLQVSSAH